MYLRCDATLTIDATGAPLCDNWTALSESEIAANIQAVNDESVLAELIQYMELAFSVPSAEVIQVAFLAGLSLPLISYLTAWGYQTVINFVNR